MTLPADVGPEEVVHAYFACMRSGGAGVADLFHEHGRLVGLGAVVEGCAAIATFYAGAVEGARPAPRLLGPLLVAGERVVAEIAIGLADGTELHVCDLFEVADGRIRSLTYFVAEH